MKRILIVSLSCVLTLNLFGCSKAVLEKEPIVIEDSSEDNIGVLKSKVEHDPKTDEENQDQEIETEANLLETTSDISSDDTDKSDSVDKENTETFKGIVMLEGMEEEVNYRTYHSEYGYQMNYEEDRFTVTSEDGIDTYMAENINPEIYPYVFINITRSEYTGENRDLSGVLSVYDKDSNQTLSTTSPEDNVMIGDYDAVHFKYIDGNQWNSLVKHIYIIALEDNYYVIQTNYFLEASEGYGVRIKAMLDTIVIEE